MSASRTRGACATAAAAPSREATVTRASGRARVTRRMIGAPLGRRLPAVYGDASGLVKTAEAVRQPLPRILTRYDSTNGVARSLPSQRFIARAASWRAPDSHNETA